LNCAAHRLEFGFSKDAAIERCPALPAKNAGVPTNRGKARRYTQTVRGGEASSPRESRCARRH
jgi:hypothetical protein